MAGQDEHPRADALRNRAALLDAAADVLAASPEASLTEVANRAGLARATLYRHFENRDALLGAIQTEALERAAAALDGAGLPDCDTREGLRRAAAALVPLGMRFRILLTEGSDADPGFIAARTRTLAPLVALLERGQKAGEISPAASTPWLGLALAGLLMTTVRAAAMGLVDADDAGELVATTFLDGLGT